jgi:hypothetical protein
MSKYVIKLSNGDEIPFKVSNDDVLGVVQRSIDKGVSIPIADTVIVNVNHIMYIRKVS